jgi:hypothetical protein
VYSYGITFDPWVKPLGDATHSWQHRQTAIEAEHQRAPIYKPLDRPSIARKWCWTERLCRERRVARAAWIADIQEYPFASAGVMQPADAKGNPHVATAYADDR